MMADVEIFKDIPGYKAILKAVLKKQIQFLVSAVIICGVHPSSFDVADSATSKLEGWTP